MCCWGIHAEVVANLHYGLLIYDRFRYQKPVSRGTSFLRRVQSDDGTWSSKWYAGAYYGTFKAISVLAPLCPGDRAVRRAEEFVLRQQHSNGGWGREDGEPIATPFALLSF